MAWIGQPSPSKVNHNDNQVFWLAQALQHGSSSRANGLLTPATAIALPLAIVDADIALSDLASCRTRFMRAKCVRRIHWFWDCLHSHSMPMNAPSFQVPRTFSPLRGAVPGDYLWTVKDNQEGLREDIDILFQPHRHRPATSALPTDFRAARTVEKGHGRVEKRTITVSSMLANYSTWPELAQVFKLESQRTNALGVNRAEIRYGVTSLPAHVASSQRLLDLTRGHWGIENGWHHRRDATMREDHSHLRMGHAPEMLAVLNNTVLGLLARQGETNVAQARRAFAYHFDRFLAHLKE